MVETSKQVRVDNWGIYFLQRLQLFFSKTDYCDLTLQFEGNVQLKVHRLVMNACTEYFAFLEQTCSALEENTILMPSNLQADVIVPIVNFMYTGMLEFHPSIFDKLYTAAETMNIAVLTKLLEAQLAPVSRSGKGGKKDREKDLVSTRHKEYKKATPKLPVCPPVVEEIRNTPSPVASHSRKVTPWKRKTISSSIQSHPASATFSSKWSSAPVERDPLLFHDNTPKPTRFEWPEDDIAPMTMYPTFDDVSLTSRPLWTKDDDQKVAPIEETKPCQVISRSKNNSTSQDFDEPVTHEPKPNVASLDVAVRNEVSNKRKADTKATSSPKRIKISTQDDETVISITTSNPSEVDHTKIVSEVLKKYPDLVKKKRNIKLKIIQAKTEYPQVKIQTVKDKLPVKESPLSSTVEPEPSSSSSVKETPSTSKEVESKKPTVINSVANKKKSVNPLFKAKSEEGPWTCMECSGQDREGAEFVLYYLFRKHMATQHHIEFDPSLCKYCGKKCSKESFMTYHLFIKHGLKPPKDVAYPKCNKCPFIAVTSDRLQEHLRTHGKDEMQCPHCHLGFLTAKDCQAHQQLAGHNSRKSSILDCAYCQKKLQSSVTLFTHVRLQHMKEARRDGVSSLDETLDIQNEDDADEEEECKRDSEIIETPVVVAAEEKKKHKVKIISNVKVDSKEENIIEASLKKATDGAVLQESEPVAVTTAATLSNIGSSLATNLGLVDIVVLDDNQQYILQQPQGQTGNAEFILPPELTGGEGILQAAAATGELNSTDELVMVLTDHDYQDEQNQGQSDNSNIVVLYSHPVEGQQGQFITSQGNLLVNSEGLLEIRNGTPITTTAGQILVNTENTTTTQATDSPVESIDLIRREIEATDVSEQRTEILKTGGEEVVNDNTENLSVLEETVIENKSGGDVVSSNDQQGGTEVADTTDSSIQEETMEVDDDVSSLQKEVLQTSVMAEDEGHLTETASHPQNTEHLNPELTALPEVVGEDVPPDSDLSVPLTQELDSDQLVLNDPNHFQEPNFGEDQLAGADEPMEVDGSSANAPYEELQSGVDEVDQQFPSSDAADVQTSNEEEIGPELAEKANEEPLETVPALNNGTEDREEEKEKEQDDGNLHPQYDDFTTDDSSQQSSSQKQRGELDKEILDDWDDTDSQQSQGHEQGPETQEEEEEEEESSANPATCQAAENVNKLMNDWDDDDEDQSKE